MSFRAEVTDEGPLHDYKYREAAVGHLIILALGAL